MTLRLRQTLYLGGHPAAPQGLDRVDLTFNKTGVSFSRNGTDLGQIAASDVVDISADAELSHSKVTVPRLWLLGVWALLTRRRDRSAFLRLTDARGSWVFSVEGIDLDGLRHGIAAVNKLWHPPEQSTAP